MAGFVAAVILVSQLIIPALSVNDVAWWVVVILLFLPFPLIGAALDLGLRARSCMKENRKDLGPQDSQMGKWDVEEIANQLDQATIPPTDGTPSDEGG